MTNRFEHYYESATASKKQFDASVCSVKEALQVSLNTSRARIYVHDNSKPVSTGWLRGSLSYPWAIVCIVIPAVLNMMM
ncbi:MAG: hypothetical protein IKX42_13035 [Fibrobacter sp.]|nr:hypothetical protein [Fibrobacter sp.]